MLKLLILFSLVFSPKLVSSDIEDLEKKEIRCLAANMYHEARGQPERGILAVGHVTMNRVKSEGFPSSVCGVVSQKIKNQCQFSWFCKKSIQISENEHFKKIKDLASMVYNGNTVDETDGALFFHNKTVDPGWNKSLKKTARIGDHEFYKRRRK